MIQTGEVARLATAMEHEAVTVGVKGRAIEERGAHRLADDIAAGAPRRTGDYAASWRVEGNEAGTDALQARRLEKGFERVDSLGRQYNQPAFLHIGPAVEAFEERFEDEVAVAIVADALI